MKNKKHLFFDLDDTLWDFAGNSEVVLRNLFVEFDLQNKLNTDFDQFMITYRKINLQLWSDFYKKKIDKQFLRNSRFDIAFNAFGYNNYPENILISEKYMALAPHGTLLKEGCISTLNYLKNNYQLHLITNGFTESQSIKLDNCGLRHYFSNIIISEEHNLVKPEKQIFELAQNLAGAQTADCVMIGDSMESDVQGAINVGWTAIYYSDRDAENYDGLQIQHLEELKEMF